ncbi:hypothetical protein Hanom_Chr04g00322571 [Helianthus anomalus]
MPRVAAVSTKLFIAGGIISVNTYIAYLYDFKRECYKFHVLCTFLSSALKLSQKAICLSCFLYMSQDLYQYVFLYFNNVHLLLFLLSTGDDVGFAIFLKVVVAFQKVLQFSKRRLLSSYM